jgi:hypothetical protein
MYYGRINESGCFVSLSDGGIANYDPRSPLVTCFGKQNHDTGNRTSQYIKKRHSSTKCYEDGAFIGFQDTVRRGIICVM